MIQDNIYNSKRNSKTVFLNKCLKKGIFFSKVHNRNNKVAILLKNPDKYIVFNKRFLTLQAFLVYTSYLQGFPERRGFQW